MQECAPSAPALPATEPLAPTVDAVDGGQGDNLHGQTPPRDPSPPMIVSATLSPSIAQLFIIDETSMASPPVMAPPVITVSAPAENSHPLVEIQVVPAVLCEGVVGDATQDMDTT